jgi:hypothetical protein
MDGPWGWHRMDAATAIFLHGKLSSFETMTWANLINSPHNKRIPVEHLSLDAQNRLIERRLDDQDDVWELRLGGRQRVWGYRVGDVMHLLWWDPEHEVCPSRMRNT